MPAGGAGGLGSGAMVHFTPVAPAGALKAPGPKYITTWLSPVWTPPPATWPFWIGNVASPGSGGLFPAARLGGGDSHRYGSGGTMMPAYTRGAGPSPLGRGARGSTQGGRTTRGAPDGPPPTGPGTPRATTRPRRRGPAAPPLRLMRPHRPLDPGDSE